VLVEGPSKAAERHAHAHADEGMAHEHDHERNHTAQLVGRTMCDRIVVFDGNPRQVGQMLPVSIYDANAHTLFGAVATLHVGPELFTLSV
jgi:tRNA-2-methylthio-N6-dimethylallyladenosine synthase